MKNKIKEFCSLLYLSIKIPISWYNPNGECIKTWPDTEFTLNPKLYSINKTLSIYVSSYNSLYGTLKLPNELGIIILGPAFSTPPTSDIIHCFLKENNISNNYQEQATNIISSVPITTYIKFINHLQLLTYGILGETFDIYENIKLTNKINFKEIEQKFIETNIQNKELQNYHNSYLWEQKLYYLIKNGNKADLISFLKDNKDLPLNEGQMANNPLRNAKNLFIGTVTKVGMFAAIPSGLDIEQTYQLIDTYSKECEQIHSLSEINNFYYSMIFDFCERIAENKIPNGISKEVYLCMCYIQNNTNNLINLSDVAKQVHRSTSYIIRKFQQELGINIGAYIRHCKLEESKKLLTYTNKSLSEISNYLCFSSQSYFQNVFKKKYGLTPMNYRKQYNLNLKL